ncbi:hypothetical protein HWV62_9779 [Athelia sp. TMB]|nr:hypothetical protein HWV62_9779 [Athelia sp. TMB]
MFRTTALSALWISLALAANANQAQSFFAANAPSYQKHKHKQVGRPHFDANWAASLDNGLFSSVEDLRTLDEEVFTTLEHPAFPQHSVRIKKSPSGFCDDSVKSYTGYIDVEARHLFFYFFESRRNPDSDDVIFWTNGGPGCSSSLGLFMELGPCRISNASGPHYHPESWTETANLFFVDQPVGVGYSYADYGETVSTTEEAAVDIAAFVAIFFEHFTKFKGRAFHMAGESYGGRYIPVFAAEVYDQNAVLVDAGLSPINLTSIIIGNGMTDFAGMMLSYFDMQCTPASVHPIQDIASCIRMKQALPRCEKWVQHACIETSDAMNCEAAMSFCSTELMVPFFNTGMNPYDISIECDGPIADTLCYPVTKHISTYLSDPRTRKMLGVDLSITKNFTSCSSQVGQAFNTALDEYHPTQDYVSALLDRGVRTLIYVGTYDWICNWIGNERWTRKLQWSGAEAYGLEKLNEWKVEGKVAGKVRAKGALTYVTVEGAGHMVPYNKPKEALELMRRWVAGEEI